ncbi:MAG: hypothetical protein WCY10_01115 [Candidatus Omnitrophota bacterium]
MSAHRKINIFIFLTLAAACFLLPALARAQEITGPASIDLLEKEKELLALRVKFAQATAERNALVSPDYSEIILYQRRQLDMERREISKQQRIVAKQEKKLKSEQAKQQRIADRLKSMQKAKPLIGDVLKKKLDEQNNLLEQVRKELEDGRKNMESHIENLKLELASQELKRRESFSKALQEDLQCKQQVQEERVKQEKMEKERKEREIDMARVKQETLEKEKKERTRKQAAQKIAAQKFIERKRRQESEQEHEALQARLDSLLEKQQKLLDSSVRAEQDLLKQNEDAKGLLDQARAMARKGETK